MRNRHRPLVDGTRPDAAPCAPTVPPWSTPGPRLGSPLLPVREEAAPGLPSATPPTWSAQPNHLSAGALSAAIPLRRGQRLAGTSLIVGVSCALFVAIGLYSTLAGVHIAAPSAIWREASEGVVLFALGLMGLFASFVTAVVALVRSRPRVLAAITLASHPGLLIGAVVVGLWTGGAALSRNIQADLGPFAALARLLLGG